MKINIVYHCVDFDGQCSAALIYNEYEGEEINLIGMNYGYNYNLDEIIDCDKLYVVDFSFSRDEMIYINSNCDLIWIDHHKTAMEVCQGLEINGSRSNRRAACVLTWEYLHPVDVLPYFVDLLGDYDIWEFKNNPDTEWFQYGLKIHKTFPDSTIWKDLLDDHQYCSDRLPLTRRICNEGKPIHEYIEKQNKIYAKKMGFTVKWEGVRFFAMNMVGNSKVAESQFDENKHDAIMIFRFNGAKWYFSLYGGINGCKYDLSVIVKKYGGGGHYAACGFEIDHLPDEIRR